MRALAIALALTTVFAGCLAPAVDVDVAPAGTPIDAQLGASTHGLLHDAQGQVLSLGTTVQAIGGQYPIGNPSSEPTIAITSDGTVFMTANRPNPTCGLAGGCPAVPYANVNNGPTLMRSSDKGQTWEDVYPTLPTGDGLKLRTWDPMVLVDPATDRVFMDDIYPIGCGWMSVSDDRGDSWLHDPLACGNPHVNDHQTIGVGKPHGTPTVGYPNLVYRCVNNLLYTGCAVSVNGGLTFSPQIPVLATMGQCGAITGHLESDSTGRVFLPVGCDGPAVAITVDDAKSWEVVEIAPGMGLHGLHVDIAIDEADNVYALWEHEGLPYYAFSTDNGATWSEAILVAAPGVTAIKFNAIAAGAPGKVAFAYVGTTHPGGYEDNEAAQCGALPALPCTDPEDWKTATWNAYIGIMEDALAASPMIQTVTANDPADPLSRGACADRCHGMTDFIDIQIDVEGRPWASFVDVCVAECVADPEVLFDGNIGFAATLQAGPALRGEAKALATILPPPVAAESAE